MTKTNTRGTALAVALILAAGAVRADEQCFDFSRMAVDTTFPIGREVDIGIGKVKVREFIKDGAPFTPANGTQQQLKITQSMIAREAAPEVAMSYVGMQLIPKEPVQEITLLAAQNLGRAGLLPAYIEINGERHDFLGSFNAADGKVLGHTPAGRVRFKSELQPDATGANGQSTWHRGRLGARAVQGGIESITLGSVAAHFDQVCFRR